MSSLIRNRSSRLFQHSHLLHPSDSKATKNSNQYKFGFLGVKLKKQTLEKENEKIHNNKNKEIITPMNNIKLREWLSSQEFNNFSEKDQSPKVNAYFI